LLNLLSNAVKFTNSGTISTALKLISKTSKSVKILLTVTDQGIGIPADKTDEIFEMFHQLDESCTKQHGGTGLGLAIVKNLVELMGGAISVASEINSGTSFKVELPFEFIAKTCVPDKAAENSYSIPPEKKEKLSILLAEDDFISSSLIVELSKNFNWNVTLAANGKEAFDLYRSRNFDAILMDCQMPEMDGIEAMRKIRELESHSGKHIPIIALTAHAMIDDRNKFISAGMDDYIAKPLPGPDIIYKTIMKYIKNNTLKE
jgi:CheY-like chemotaxis protein